MNAPKTDEEWLAFEKEIDALYLSIRREDLHQAIRTALILNACAGFYVYVHKIYCSEQVNHDIYVSAGFAGFENDGFKKFDFAQIDEAISYFIDQVAPSYYKHFLEPRP